MHDQRALDLAYRYLSRRERSEAELRAHLSRRGVDKNEVEYAVATLKEQGYLDDARFARLFVEDKRALAQWGSNRIRRSLVARGIDREVADEALRADEGRQSDHDRRSPGSALGPSDPGSHRADGDLARALELLRRRFPSPSSTRRDRERALGVLLRKGYDSELALDALARYAREESG